MATSKNPLLPGRTTKLSSKITRPDSAPSGALPKISNLTAATKSLSVSAKPIGTALAFGKPSSAGTASTASSSVLTGLLKQTASGGIASALGGGLSGLLGLGSIISGFISLFGGGKSALPPLVQFQAPVAQNLVSDVSSRSRASSPAAVSSVNVSNSGTTNTNGSQQSPSAYQYQSVPIAQAVKQALLNSSSLNDVIAEI
jgi:predicted lipid-binding transport protein (Tim44 family)